MFVFFSYWGICAFFEEIEKEEAIKKALLYRSQYNKPILNAGCQSTDWGDANLDIIPRNVKNFVQGNIEDLSQFTDKTFSVAYASHVLEHVNDPVKAIAELKRVAHEVIIVVPHIYTPGAWFFPEHKRVFVGDKTISINGVFNDILLAVWLLLNNHSLKKV